MSSDATMECMGHRVPTFGAVFPKVFRAGIDVMTPEQIGSVAGSLSEADRRVVADFLGAAGIAAVLEGLDPSKAEPLGAHYAAEGEPDINAFRQVYPRVAVTTNNTLSIDQLRDMLGHLAAEDMASQSLFFGDEGRKLAFEQIDRARLELIFDHTEDWVLLATGRRALANLPHYTATLQKQERLGRKLQGVETIALKARHQPRASYLKWLAGPHKGREALHNEQLLGADRVRVREGGLLGVLPVTIGVDSAVAKRGTKHLITEVGLLPLVDLIEHDYHKAAPAGDIQRKNHGMTDLDGVAVYRFESILPRDRSLGYYCHRMMHYTDYVRAFEIKAEVYNFDDELDEWFHYQQVDPGAALTDADFDPKNRGYRL